MWFSGSILTNPWTEYASNEEVLGILAPKRTLKMKFLGKIKVNRLGKFDTRKSY